MAKKVFYVSILKRDFVRREEYVDNAAILWSHIYKKELCWDSSDYGDVIDSGDLIVLTAKQYRRLKSKSK